MTSRFEDLVVDCRDPEVLADFWCAVLGYRRMDPEPGDEVEIAAAPPSADALRAAPVPPAILFIRVPEDKAVKNRLHVDVTPIDASQAEEVERLLALGARHADVGQGPDVRWVVMADPEGNEFCVLRSLAPD